MACLFFVTFEAPIGYFIIFKTVVRIIPVDKINESYTISPEPFLKMKDIKRPVKIVNTV